MHIFFLSSTTERTKGILVRFSRFPPIVRWFQTILEVEFPDLEKEKLIPSDDR